MLQRMLLLCLVTALVGLAIYFHDFASIQHIKSIEAEIALRYVHRPIVVLFLFVALQTLLLCLCIPGAFFSMALLGGAIFGALSGTLIVLVSVTIGDSLSFLTARFLLRDQVRRQFRTQLAVVEQGIERDGAYYLLGMRLMPVLPFFVVNLTMGVTRMPLKIFAPVSFVGLAPSVALYVNAGTRLSEIRGRSDVISLKVLIIFAFVGATPILSHLALRALRRRF